MKFFDAQRHSSPILPGFDDDHLTRSLIAIVLFLVAFFIVTTPAWLMDGRTIEGVGVWVSRKICRLPRIAFFHDRRPRSAIAKACARRPNHDDFCIRRHARHAV